MADSTDDCSAYLVGLTTLGSLEAAGALVERLVGDRVVACGTLLPATSIFRWDGAITREEEVMVVFKTTRAQWPALAEAIAAHHPYDVPELLALPVLAGAAPYLRWLDDATARPGTRDR